jgi:hypothetical protein
LKQKCKLNMNVNDYIIIISFSGWAHKTSLTWPFIFYWSTCTKPWGEGVIYLCVGTVLTVCLFIFFFFAIGLWNILFWQCGISVLHFIFELFWQYSIFCFPFYFYDFGIRFWTCSYSVVFFSFSFHWSTIVVTLNLISTFLLGTL